MIITVGNTKGGVGKSTISMNLAVEASIAGHTVLIVDTDPQGSVIDFRNERDTEDISVVSVISNKLHKDIEKFKTSFDFIIIDAGGRDNGVFRSAIVASDLFILPVLPSQLDVWAAQDAVDAFEEMQTFRDIKGRIVLNMVDERTKLKNDVLDAVSAYKESLPLLTTQLHNLTAFKHAVPEGKGVSEYDKNGKAAKEINALFHEILDTVKGEI